MRRPNLRQRGFSFLEMVGSLLLIGLFFLLVDLAFSSLMTTIRSGNDAANKLQRMNVVQQRLEFDVSDAAELRWTNGQCQMRDSAGHVVTWSTNDNGMTRTTDTSTQTWPMPVSMRLSESPAGVLVEAGGQKWVVVRAVQVVSGGHP